MKSLLFSFLTLVLMARACNPKYREFTPINFDNKLAETVMFTMPVFNYDLNSVPDTTMLSYQHFVHCVPVDGYQSRIMHSPIDSFEEWIPTNSEYYSMFVIKLATSSKLNDCFQNDDYYVRYDLTIDDIHSLCDKDGVLHISYPPSEAMKDVKMWPPYEEVIKAAK